MGKVYGKRGIGFMGLRGLGERPPARIQGVYQKAVEAVPPCCQRCGSDLIFRDQMEPRRFYCFGCHEDWFLVGGAPWNS